MAPTQRKPHDGGLNTHLPRLVHERDSGWALGELAVIALREGDIPALARTAAHVLRAATATSRTAIIELTGDNHGPPVLRATEGLNRELLLGRPSNPLQPAAALLQHSPVAPDAWRLGALLVPVMGQDAAGVVISAHGRPWGILAAGPFNREHPPRTLRLLQQAAELLGAAVERQLAQQSLRDSESRFRLLVEGVTGFAVFLLDPAGRVASWNSGAQSLFGWKAEDIIGRPLSDLYVPEDVRLGTPARELRVAASEGRTEDEGWRRRQDGSHFVANVVVTALRDAGGRLRGFAQLTRDLTEKRADEERQRLLRDVQDALASRDEFLSIAGHELRTPITSLQLALQSIQRQLQRRNDTELQTRVDRCERQVARLAHLVDDWLGIARLGTGALKLELQSFDLRDALGRVLSHYEEEARRAGCSFEVVAGSPVPGHWDRARLEQVLANVVANAIKYGAGQPIQILLNGGVNLATISVTDRGIGVAAEQQAHIFERFGRAVSARSYGGIGLGLYMTRRIVEAHGGSIRVASSPGEGATFTIELPLAPPQPRTAR